MEKDKNDMQFLDHFSLIVDEGEYEILFFFLSVERR